MYTKIWSSLIFQFELNLKLLHQLHQLQEATYVYIGKVFVAKTIMQGHLLYFVNSRKHVAYAWLLKKPSRTNEEIN